MKAIFKYPIEASSVFRIQIPKDAQILTVQVQNDIPCIWALVDTEKEEEYYMFQIVGTGKELPKDFIGRYIGTFQLCMGGLVFHLWLISHLKVNEI